MARPKKRKPFLGILDIEPSAPPDSPPPPESGWAELVVEPLARAFLDMPADWLVRPNPQSRRMPQLLQTRRLCARMTGIWKCPTIIRCCTVSCIQSKTSKGMGTDAAPPAYAIWRP